MAAPMKIIRPIRWLEDLRCTRLSLQRYHSLSMAISRFATLMANVLAAPIPMEIAFSRNAHLDCLFAMIRPRVSYGPVASEPRRCLTSASLFSTIAPTETTPSPLPYQDLPPWNVIQALDPATLTQFRRSPAIIPLHLTHRLIHLHRQYPPPTVTADNTITTSPLTRSFPLDSRPALPLHCIRSRRASSPTPPTMQTHAWASPYFSLSSFITSPKALLSLCHFTSPSIPDGKPCFGPPYLVEYRNRLVRAWRRFGSALQRGEAMGTVRVSRENKYMGACSL